jgi:hypothetical protein
VLATVVHRQVSNEVGQPHERRSFFVWVLMHAVARNRSAGRDVSKRVASRAGCVSVEARFDR